MTASTAQPDVALSNSAHLYVRSTERERLLAFFSDVLGLTPRKLTPRKLTTANVSTEEAMYAVEFSNGARVSVEFTDDALSDKQAERGAWLELTVADSGRVQAKAEAFGLRRIAHPATPFGYIQAPGGQVFRIVSAGEAGGS